MGSFITGNNSERLMGKRQPLFSGKNSLSTEDYELEALKEIVSENGCLARGTQEICKLCGKLALSVPICREQSDTINDNE